MPYTVTVKSKKSFDWLKKLIDNTVDSPNSRPMIENYEELMEWYEGFVAVQAELDAKKAAAEAAKQEKLKAKKSAPKKKASAKKQDKVGEFDCADHPTYGGVRRPRTDCKKCWSIFKKLHPMDYQRARRSFNLSQKRAKSGKNTSS